MQVSAIADAIKKAEGDLSAEDIKRILDEVRERYLNLSEDAVEVEHSTAIALARRRVLVLAVTMFVELATAFIIMPFEKTIAKYATVYAFAPLVSAICGNFGLQSAAIVIRGIAVGTISDEVKVILRELTAGVLCGIPIGILAGIVAWASTGFWEAIPVLVASLVAGMATSGLLGAVIPLVTKSLAFDPAIVAGPGETALQDCVSYFTFLAVLTLLMKVVS